MWSQFASYGGYMLENISITTVHALHFEEFYTS